MRLELRACSVREIAFGQETRFREGRLEVSRGRLAELVADPAFQRLRVELAHPGEACRIAQVFDVVEPRAKLDPPGSDFPGVLGPLVSAGQGVSLVLRGAAVVILDGLGEARGAQGELGNVIDMAGPGAEMGLYGHSHLVVLAPEPAPGVSLASYQGALRRGVLRAAVELARAARDASPDHVEVYELPSPESVPPGLPRVAYICQVHSQQHPTGPGEPVLYGDNVRQLLPTVLHPNEVLDGAIVRSFASWGAETYTWQNHPVILELYRRHGRELDFAGVIVTVAHFTQPERERSVLLAANLARWALRAQGVVLTKIGGGAPHVDMGQTAQRCEALGLKTALMVYDLSGDGSSEGAVLFNFPEVDAIVTVGGSSATVALPAMARAILASAAAELEGRALGPLRVRLGAIGGAMNQLGASRLRAVLY